MPTAALTARAGLLAVSTASTASSTEGLAELTNISFRAARPGIDVTNNDSSGWRETLPGIGSFVATATANYTPTTTLPQFIARDAHEDERQLAVAFFPSTSTPYVWDGLVYVTDWELTGATPDQWTFNITMESAGPLTFSTST